MLRTRPGRPGRRAALAAGALAAVAVAALTVALTRDSGGPKPTMAQYSAAVQSVLVRLASDFRTAGNTGTSATFRRMKISLDHAATGLEQIPPPADAKADQQALVSELRDFASQIDLVRASVDFGDVPTIVSHLHDVNAPVAINRTLDRLTARGYHITVRVAGVKRDEGTDE